MPASGWRPYSLLKRCQVLRVRVCSTCPRTTGWPDSLALHQFVLFVKFRPLKHFTRQSARASIHTRGNPVFLVLTWNKKKSYLIQVLSLNIDHGRLTSHLFTTNLARLARSAIVATRKCRMQTCTARTHMVRAVSPEPKTMRRSDHRKNETRSSSSSFSSLLLGHSSPR